VKTTILRISTSATLLLGALNSAVAQDCQVLDQFPVAINEQGEYCPHRSHKLELTGSEWGISILASDANLDLREHTLSNLATAGIGLVCNTEFTKESTTGIQVLEARNVSIHGGALRCVCTGRNLRTFRARSVFGVIESNSFEFIRIQQSDFAEIVGFGDFSTRADNHIAEPGAPHDGFVREVFINGNTVSNNG